MPASLDHLHVTNGDPVKAADVATALTAATLVYDDGATQTFDPDGSTTYVEHGTTSDGTWSVEGDGRFASFWPPSFRATYDLRWAVDSGAVVGLSFVDVASGATFNGCYA
jgi:hypothetical protein